MKTLILLRHAKSDWADPTLADHDRPLAARGRDAAPRMGAWLKAHGPMPDLALCSTATRARQTLALALEALGAAPETRFDRGLYLAGGAGVLARLRRAPDEAETVLLVGHNPDLEQLARRLAATGDEAARTRLAEKYPTAGLAVIELPVDRWAEAGPGGRLVAFETPKTIKS
ncbi:histidine phosphatase family protein [Inquilinus sp. Marseille-Q2685]|uniref:SixA phosphatase family protein n=1 Tax=Inquilinus sp. Marseille-Q2685 TaxID=2866581 RepID=UPI001CE3DE57|nr:histidine phosphatase family protein [Inquilinus sp. Marseille-Q2685]